MDFPRQIYMIRHNKTGRIYIGSSRNVHSRCKHHLQLLRTGKHTVEDMQEDFDKYGEDYTVSVLETITEYADRNKEYEWMKKYSSHIREKGYNYKDQAKVQLCKKNCT